MVFIRKKIQSFYFPFLLFVIPICLLHNAFFELGLYENEYDIRQYAIQMLRCISFSIGTNEPWIQQLWFLKTLFLAEVLFAIFGYLFRKHKVWKLYIAIIVIVAMASINKNIVPHFFEVNVIWPIKAWLFIEFGRLLINRKYNLPIMPIALMFIMAWFACGYLVHFSFQNSYGWQLLTQITLSVCGFLTLYDFASLIKRIHIIRVITCRIGQDTLYIFFWHYIMFAFISASYSLLFCKECYGMIKSDMRLNCINWSIYVLLSIVLVELGTRWYKNITHRKK